MTVVTIGIIGTSGQKAEREMLNPDVWKAMLWYANRMVSKLADTGREAHLISGGGPWAEHVAVKLFLAGKAKHLTLHVPAQIENGKFRELGGPRWCPGKVLNFGHSYFGKTCKLWPIREIQQAHEAGAKLNINQFGAAKLVAKDSKDFIISFSTGIGETPRTYSVNDREWADWQAAGLYEDDSKDTWRDSDADKKIHIPIRSILADIERKKKQS